MPSGEVLSGGLGLIAISVVGWNTWSLLGVSGQEVLQVTTAEIADVPLRSPDSTEPIEPRIAVVCYAGGKRRAVAAAQIAADHERAPMYVLKGYRPNRRGFRSPVYYVSRLAVLEIEVDGLPSRDLIGPPYSAPALLETVSPRVSLPSEASLVQ